MCFKVQCSSCGLATFAGCGAHAEQVLRNVAPSDRCQCKSGANIDNIKESNTPSSTRSSFWGAR